MLLRRDDGGDLRRQRQAITGVHLEEADEPESGLRFAFRPLQFLPSAFEFAGDACDGGWNRF